MLAGRRLVARRFRNRLLAGEELGVLLAEECAEQVREGNLIVLGLPRGGVPVAHAAARTLDAPVDIFVVRKLGAPGRPELAMGAIASGGVTVLNHYLIDQLGITEESIASVAAAESAELERREALYRMGRAGPELEGMSVVVVDDGVATGASMRVAVEAILESGPRFVCAAAPVASDDAFSQLRQIADNVVVVAVPKHFRAVGYWYDDFTQTTDEEVVELLA